MRIDRTCGACNGTGQVPSGRDGSTTCYSCHGVGTSYEGEVANGSETLNERLTTLEGVVADIMAKCNDIFEKVNE